MPRRTKRSQQATKKKLKKPTKSSVMTPKYTRRQFEELNQTIMSFTSDSQHLNKLERGCELERDEIDQQWTRLIQGLYPADDPKSYELLAQVDNQHEMEKH